MNPEPDQFPGAESKYTTSVGFLIATSLVYLGVGYYSFYRAGIVARENGLLGHY